MDTISRENNSMLPVGGIIVGVIALLLGGYAAIQVSKVNKTLTEQETKLAKIDEVERIANSAVSSAESAKKALDARMKEVQAGFDQVGPIIGTLQERVVKLEESAKKPAPAPANAKKGEKGGAREPAVPGTEYVVKSGDTGMKIANANHVSIKDLQDVNPGVNWNKLKVGDRVKLPAKK